MDDETVDSILADIAPRLSTIEREALALRIARERGRTVEDCIRTVQEFDGLNLDMVIAALRTLYK